MQQRQKALIALSGGVDSSVAALLMKQAGYDCAGATMLLHRKCEKNSENAPVCGSNEDVRDAERVASALGMPFHILDCSELFDSAVIQRFVSAYENGRTPNPCIDCNRYLKFDEFFKRAMELGYDCMATGHYAQIDYCQESGRYLLKKAADPAKDQSYVLWSLRQEQLARTFFPLGGMSKVEARELAEQSGLLNAQKRDSQDICFVPDGKYANFVEQYTKKAYPSGDFVTTDGKILGQHKGIIRYTVGQKKGLGLVLPQPLYVCAIRPDTNQVVLGRSEELFSRELIAHDLNLISLPEIRGELRVKAKVRYRHTEEWATVTQPETDTIRVVFDEPQRAITKGQSVVLYDGDVVVGGGIIA